MKDAHHNFRKALCNNTCVGCYCKGTYSILHCSRQYPVRFLDNCQENVERDKGDMNRMQVLLQAKLTMAQAFHLTMYVKCLRSCEQL